MQQSSQFAFLSNRVHVCSKSADPSSVISQFSFTLNKKVAEIFLSKYICGILCSYHLNLRQCLQIIRKSCGYRPNLPVSDASQQISWTMQKESVENTISRHILMDFYDTSRIFVFEVAKLKFKQLFFC